MSNVTRAALAIGVCAAGIGVAACGSGTSAATPSSHATVGAAPSSASPASASSTPSAAAAAIVLTVADLPQGGPTLTQISDGEMGNQPTTDQRGFANTGNSYRIEDDVLVDTSTQSAAADYPQLRDATKAQVTTITSTSMPSGLGSQGDEYIGTTSTGYSEIGITFQEGDVIAVLLLEDSSGAVDQTYAEAVAHAQDQKIRAAAS
jgi:hypothetical protein